VGHETDWTLIDLVADARAPTPTGAAEIAVPVRSELEATLARLGARLAGCTSRNLDRHRQAVRAAARALPSPDQLLGVKRRRFDETESRLERALSICIERQRTRWAAVRLSPLPLIRLKDTARTRLQIASRRQGQALPARLDRLRSRLTQADRLLATLKLSEQAILERGYALVLDQSGALVRRAAQTSIGQVLELRFADGAAHAIATDGNSRKSEPRTPTKLPSRSKNHGGQGSLF
jgi:exodeoxyribonuclease VII large subunit